MAYGPNTSRTNRLPHGFFENLYARLEESGDLLNQIEAGDPPEDVNDMVELIRFFDAQLRRQRQSHLGMESI
jgi:hypothetical protein